MASSKLLLLFTFIIYTFHCNYADPIVKTNWSLIRGFTRDVLGHPVNHFYGIPYALPPIGRLRFKRPVPLSGHHKGIYSATSFRHGCMQTAEDEAKHSTISSSENCLFISVWSPINGTTELKPVLVFIHGSGYVYGSAANPHMYGGYLSGLGDLVFVNFNYRLGSLGLMYGEPDKIPGNLALWDQKLALEWIQENIKAFGGDPSRVTMMGHSAGATFATMHLISNETRRLYSQAMVNSGTACIRSGLDSPEIGLRKTRELVRRVGCERLPLNDMPLTEEEVDCLMKIDARKLVDNQGDLVSQGSTGCSSSMFLPTYGDRFLPHSTDYYLAKGDFVQGIPIVTGKVPNEVQATLPSNVSNVGDAAGWIVSTIEKITGRQDVPKIQEIVNYYLNSVGDANIDKINGALVALLNDLCEHCPMLKFAENWAKFNKNTVYLYYYTYVTQSFRNDSSRAYGPVHADDTRILFGLPFKDYDQYGDEDRQFSLQLIKMFSHFVHHGSMKWPAISAKGAETIDYQYTINGKIDPQNVGIDSDTKICQLLP